MPNDTLTAESLLAAFIAAGYDTPEKLTGLLVMAKAQTTRAAKVIALDALNAKQTAAVSAINAERAALQDDITDLAAQIIAAVTPAAS